MLALQGLGDPPPPPPRQPEACYLSREAKVGWPWLCLVTEAVRVDEMAPGEYEEERKEVCPPKKPLKF